MRQFCHKIIRTKTLGEDLLSLLHEVDKMVDLCLLVETQAFIEATAQCDVEVVRGLSHQVRNPLTVIGGNIARLKRRSAPDDPTREIYDVLMAENERLEAMVNDAATLHGNVSEGSGFSTHLLAGADSGDDNETQGGVPFPTRWKPFSTWTPEASDVHGDKDDIPVMFLHLLQNAMEAVDRARPLIRISSRRWKGEPSFVEVEIFNTGRAPSAEEIASLFVPFSSTKPSGTGFGLSIARLAARKSLGDILLEPVPEQGVRSVVKLPGVAKDP